MDSCYVRCKDLNLRPPQTLDRIRETQSSSDPKSMVNAWVEQLPPKLPLPQRCRRHPLREIQQPKLHHPSYAKSFTKQPARTSQSSHVQRIMADKSSPPPRRRGRGRPRGSGVLGGRGRKSEHPKDVFPISTDGVVESPKEDNVTRDGDPFDVQPPLVLRPVESLSSSSRRSPNRSPTRGKGASVVKKGQLATMNPAIRFVSHETATERGGLPPAVKNLWENTLYHILNESHFIPLGLKDRITSLFNTPRKSKLGLSTANFDSSQPFDHEDLDLIWTTLSDITLMADQYRNSASEAHWVGSVVAPMLHLVRRLSPFKDSHDRNRPLLEVLDISTTEISPQSLCPYSEDPNLFRDLDKRIDYAIGLRLSANERDLPERGQFAENHHTSINQTSNFANLTPIFINIEVKRRHVDKDPMIQLAAWIAAEFNKRIVEGYSLEMPTFSINVDGDYWELHVAYAESGSQTEHLRLNMLGTFDIGNTMTIPNSVQIFNVLCGLAKWGLGDFRNRVNREILDKYRLVSSDASV